MGSTRIRQNNISKNHRFLFPIPRVFCYRTLSPGYQNCCPEFKKEYHKTIAQLNGDKFLKRLSVAALETLAIIAYKQPVTKGEIESIRGVSSDYAVQKLLEKELIVISGRNEKLPGHPLLYTTSKSFMDYFGINSPEDLPKIKEVLADQIVLPTHVSDALQASDAEATPESDFDTEPTEPIIEETDPGAGEES